VDTPEGRGTVVEQDLLRQRVKVRMEESPETIAVFANADIAVLRSGKAKKNDPPIPADLAPISGSGKRVKKQELKEEAPVLLDPIKFRYSEEAIVDEPEEELLPEEIQEEPQKKNNRRRNRNKNQRREKPAESAPQEPESAEPQAPAEENANKPKKNNHRKYYHHRRKPKQGGQSE
jgi:hypothetical protein